MNSTEISLHTLKALDGPGHEDTDTDYCKRHYRVYEWVTGTKRGMNALEDIFTYMEDCDTGEMLLARLEKKMNDDISMEKIYAR